MSKMEKPLEVEIILNSLIKSGYEAYIVGGAVRDFILGEKPDDFDLATSASVEEIMVVFKDYKIITTGLRHGTITLRINKKNFEVTTYRNGVETLKEDLLLRDFTLNSLAYTINDEVIDYTNGLRDIKEKVIRLNCDNEAIFTIDPLRILRALRLALKYNFSIHEETKKNIFKHCPLLKNVSVERITIEFNKMLVIKGFAKTIIEYFEVFKVFLPELAALKDFEQHNEYHIYDCLEHTLEVVDNVENKLELKLAALYHDLGKPDTFTLDDNKVGHFYGHPEVSMQMTKRILNRMKYNKETSNIVLKLIKYHDYPLRDDRKSLVKLISKIGLDEMTLLLKLKEADIKGQNPLYNSRLSDIKQIEIYLKEMIQNEEYLTMKQLNIKGYDLIAIGYKQGKILGETLKLLHKSVLEGKLPNDKNILLSEASRLLTII